MDENIQRHEDQEVIDQVLHGNVNAFERLLVRYGERVHRIVSRHVPPHDMEEVVQDVFVRAYESLPSFKGESVFSRWLSSIAVRTCSDYWRRAYRSREVPMTLLTDRHRDWLEEVITGESELARREGDARREAEELLDRALAEMSPEERMVLEMMYLEGFSTKEIADLLGLSIANVKVRAFRARRKMEKLLTGVLAGKGRVP